MRVLTDSTSFACLQYCSDFQRLLSSRGMDSWLMSKVDATLVNEQKNSTLACGCNSLLWVFELMGDWADSEVCLTIVYGLGLKQPFATMTWIHEMPTL